MAVAHLHLVRRMQTRRIVVTGVALISAVVGYHSVLAATSNKPPLGHSDAEVRVWVLQKTPIGTSRQQVMAMIANEGWSGHREFRGVGDRKVFNHRYGSYGAELGSYHRFFFPFFIWPCHASAFWLFGPDDRVVDVYVSSWCEGL
jgi:hypothetical protein